MPELRTNGGHLRSQGSLPSRDSSNVRAACESQIDAAVMKWQAIKGKNSKANNENNSNFSHSDFSSAIVKTEPNLSGYRNA